jgi:CheY-like chemotaxis protein
MAKKILIVDDEEGIIFLIKRRLVKLGYEVTEAHNGLDGITLAKQKHPDLILLDFMMPELSGLEACRMLKSDPQYESIKIVLLTARDQQKDKDVAKEVGADGYITKPFEPDDLIAKVKELIGS